MWSREGQLVGLSKDLNWDLSQAFTAHPVPLEKHGSEGKMQI